MAKNEQMPIWACLLFGLVFGGVALGIFLGILLPSHRAARLVNDRNALELQARVYEHETGAIVNNVQMYRLRLVVHFPDGTTRTMRTQDWFSNPSVTHPRCTDDQNPRFINVRVRGNDVAVVGFPPPSNTMLWIFVAAFGAVGVGMLTAAVVIKVRRIKATILLTTAGAAGLMVMESNRRATQPRATNSNPATPRQPTAAQRRKQQEKLYNEVKSNMEQMNNETAMLAILDHYKDQLDNDSYFRLRGEMHYMLKEKSE